MTADDGMISGGYMQGGWTCSQCGTFVPQGATHFCAYRSGPAYPQLTNFNSPQEWKYCPHCGKLLK